MEGVIREGDRLKAAPKNAYSATLRLTIFLQKGAVIIYSLLWNQLIKDPLDLNRIYISGVGNKSEFGNLQLQTCFISQCLKKLKELWTLCKLSKHMLGTDMNSQVFPVRSARSSQHFAPQPWQEIPGSLSSGSLCPKCFPLAHAGQLGVGVNYRLTLKAGHLAPKKHQNSFYNGNLNLSAASYYLQ